MRFGFNPDTLSLAVSILTLIFIIGLYWDEHKWFGGKRR